MHTQNLVFFPGILSAGFKYSLSLKLAGSWVRLTSESVAHPWDPLLMQLGHLRLWGLLLLLLARPRSLSVSDPAVVLTCLRAPFQRLQAAARSRSFRVSLWTPRSVCSRGLGFHSRFSIACRRFQTVALGLVSRTFGCT